MPSVFDGCGLPQVVPIPDAGWTDDVSVPEAPQTITECTTVPLPMPAEPACPEITASVVFDIVSAPQGASSGNPLLDEFGNPLLDESGNPLLDEFGGGGGSGGAEGLGLVALEIVPGECCSFEILLAADLPCPDLAEGVVEAQTETVGPGEEPYAVLSFLPAGGNAAGEACAFEFALAVGFASDCPQDFSCPASVGPPTVTAFAETVAAGSQYAVLTVVEDPACTFAFDLAVGFAAGCTRIFAGTSTSSLTYGGAPSASLTFVPVSDCEYRIDSDVVFPCSGFAPEYEADVELTTPPGRYLVMDVVPGGNCTFDFQLAAGFPCRTLTPGDVTAWYDSPDRTRAVFRRRTVGECEYALDLAVGFPCPQVVQGPVVVQEVPCFASPGGEWSLTEISPCTYQLGMLLRVPQRCQDVDLTPSDGPTFSGITNAEIGLTACLLTLEKTTTTWQIKVTPDGLFAGLEEIDQTTEFQDFELTTCQCPQGGTAICENCCSNLAVPYQFLLTPLDDNEPFADGEPFDKWSDSSAIGCTDYNNLNVSVVLTKTDGACNTSDIESCCWVSEPILVCNTGQRYTGAYPSFTAVDCDPFPCDPILARWELSLGFTAGFPVHLNLVQYDAADPGLTTPLWGGSWHSWCCRQDQTPTECLDTGISVPPLDYATSIATAGQFWHPYLTNYMDRNSFRDQVNWGAPHTIELVPLWPAGFDYDAFVAECPP